MANGYATGQLDPLVSAFAGMKLKDDLIGPLDIFNFSVPETLPKGKDTDTLIFEYYKELHDHDTYGSAPTPIVSRRTGTVTNGTALTFTSTNTTLQLGMYGNYLEIDAPTRDIKGPQVLQIGSGKIKNVMRADIAKLAFRTFNGLDGTAAVRFANGVANETLVIAEIAMADIKVAGAYFWTNQVQPIRKAMDVKNNFNTMYLKASFILYVHDDVAIDVLENLTAGTDYIPVGQYGNDMMGTVSTQEEAHIIRYGMRVVRSPWVQAATGVAVNATANMKQSGGVNVTYHNFALGADAFVVPSLGKTIEADIMVKPGTQKRVAKARGMEFGIYEPTRSKADPHALTWGVAYEFWMGDTAGAQGGLLLPSLNSAGTTVYKAFKIITTASA